MSISAAELDRWALYYLEEPWGSNRDNLHAATICAVIANVHRSQKGRAYSPADFMVMGALTKAARSKAMGNAIVQIFRTVAKGKRPAKKPKR